VEILQKILEVNKALKSISNHLIDEEKKSHRRPEASLLGFRGPSSAYPCSCPRTDAIQNTSSADVASILMLDRTTCSSTKINKAYINTNIVIS
jgi:hypothetical protein